jgi:nondiscriminating aspartyl-tRNA synthetase
MERIRTADIGAHEGQRVRVAGWLHALRRLGGVSFAVIRDGWGMVQAVTESDDDLAPLLAEGLREETVLAVEGWVVRMPAAIGGYELHDPSLEVLSPVREALDVPLNKRDLGTSLPHLLDHATVLNRHPARRALFRLQATAMAGFRQTLGELGFTEIQTPKIVASATESGANVFRIDYFGQPAYLAQSPQFYKQIMVGVLERVFEVGPVFRAEPHDTTRHTNEYVSLDAELGFIRDHYDVMAVLREAIAGIMQSMAESSGPELTLLKAQLPEVPSEIPHIHFSEALEMVGRALDTDLSDEPDLAPEHERWLGRWAQDVHGSDLLFVTGYPMRKRPFYTHPDHTMPGYSNSFDLLFRGTELVTGGQRLHLYADYVRAMAQAGLPEEPFAYYLETFRYGMPPHGGFAIGLERLLMQLVGASNLRLTTLFPRDLTRLVP